MGNLAIHWFIEASYEKHTDWRQRKKVLYGVKPSYSFDSMTQLFCVNIA